MSGFTDRLKSISDRYDELNRLMADPDVAADYSRLNELAQERSEIEDLVRVFRRYEEVERQIAQNSELLEEDDPEMRELAELENEELEAELEELEETLKLLLSADGSERREERDSGGASGHRR